MSRTIPTNIDSVLDDDFVIPVFFVELDFDTDPVYLHTDIGDITVLAHDWIGAGGLGTIGQIEETEENKAPGVKLRLQITDESSGSIFQELTTQDFYQRPCVIYMTTRNTITGALLDDPFEIYRGRCDVPEIVHGETNSFVDLLIESEWADADRASGELFSNAQLQSEYSGDLGFEFLNDLVNRKITWGSDRVANIGQPRTVRPSIPGLPPGFTFPF